MFSAMRSKYSIDTANVGYNIFTTIYSTHPTETVNAITYLLHHTLNTLWILMIILKFYYVSPRNTL